MDEITELLQNLGMASLFFGWINTLLDEYMNFISFLDLSSMLMDVNSFITLEEYFLYSLK
jgi:hypothetical protein